MQQVIKQLQVHIASKVCELRQQPEWCRKPVFLLVSAGSFTCNASSLAPASHHRRTSPGKCILHGAALQNSTPAWGRLIVRLVEPIFETHLIRSTFRRMLSSPLRSAWSV